MTASSTDTRQSMDSCPPLEDIAAFLDGTLPPEERERMTEHLARCESCYEVFSGAVHFQEEEHSSAEDTGGGGVIPFPLADTKDRASRRTPRWLPLAASVVLVAGLGFFTWKYFLVPPQITVAGLVEPFQDPSRLVEYRYQPEDVKRGDEEGEEDIASPVPPFLVGVYLVDLRLSAEAGDVKTTQDILYGLQSELDPILFMQKEAKSFKKEADEMKSPAALRRFASTLPQRESNLQSWLAEYSSFSFGLWTEGGRLAAKVKSPEFFKRRDNRRFLSSLLKNPPGEGYESLEDVPVDLRAIEAIWDRGDFSEGDYDALAERFQEIIKAYESSSSEHDDLLLPDE